MLYSYAMPWVMSLWLSFRVSLVFSSLCYERLTFTSPLQFPLHSPAWKAFTGERNGGGGGGAGEGGGGGGGGGDVESVLQFRFVLSPFAFIVCLCPVAWAVAICNDHCNRFVQLCKAALHPGSKDSQKETLLAKKVLTKTAQVLWWLRSKNKLQPCLPLTGGKIMNEWAVYGGNLTCADPCSYYANT